MNKLTKGLASIFAGVFIFALVFTTVQNYVNISDMRIQLRYYNHALYLLADYLREIKADNIDNLRRDITQVAAIADAMKKINGLAEENQKSVEMINNIVDYIIKAPKIEAAKKQIKELGLRQINVLIKNKTVPCLGSGSTIKYGDKFYILSVAHLVENTTDKLELWENGEKVCDLKIIKMDKSVDLCLFAPVDEEIVPHIYTILANEESLPAEQIYVVGNPMGIEDMLSDGRVVTYEDIMMYYIDHSYFGSSGGGIYNTDGEIVGVIDIIVALNSTGELSISRIPPFVINGAIRLSVIKKFIQDIT